MSKLYLFIKQRNVWYEVSLQHLSRIISHESQHQEHMLSYVRWREAYFLSNFFKYIFFNLITDKGMHTSNKPMEEDLKPSPDSSYKGELLPDLLI